MEYLSLYDHLGKAAGSDLGLKVSKMARHLGIPIETRKLNNKAYDGNILTYPKDFLDFYFKYLEKLEIVVDQDFPF